MIADPGPGDHRYSGTHDRINEADSIVVFSVPFTDGLALR